jgi:hypothetical protein
MGRRLVVVGITLHFVFIVVVATHSNEWMATVPALSPATALVDYYSAVTFANRNFGFFAVDGNSARAVTCDSSRRLL